MLKLISRNVTFSDLKKFFLVKVENFWIFFLNLFEFIPKSLKIRSDDNCIQYFQNEFFKQKIRSKM